MGQQFMSEPEHSSPRQKQGRLYNDDPREQYAQPHFQERVSGEGSYEEGYQGYSASYLQGEKLRPTPPPALQGWKIVLIVLIIALVVTGSGALGSLISVIFGLLGGSFGLVVAAGIVLAAVSTRPVPLPTSTFAAADHTELSIHNDAGNVRILRGESHQVEVRGTRYVSKLFGEGSEVPLFSTQDGDRITITSKHWSLLRFFNIGYVNVDVSVPASSDVQMHCNAGTLDIIGISGRVNASTNAGTIMVVASQLADGSRLYTNAGTMTIRQSTLHGATRGHTNAGTISIVVRADGRPHVTPLVAVWLDGALHFSTGSTEQKALNLRGNPHVILTTGCNHWDAGLDVVVEGDAVQITDDDALKRLAEAWATKWDGRWQFEARNGGFHHTSGGMALVFSVTPTKILAFAKGTFSHTRHRF